jgi:predicted acylesterase/phospholipase RssA
MLVVQRLAAQAQVELADLVIRPHVGHIRWDEMARADELLAAGREAVVESLADIKSLIETASKSPPRWYQLRRGKPSSTKTSLAS